MNWQLVSLDAQPAQHWRNGGGTTRELLAWPQRQDWTVRLSVADVQSSGPFSRFDGVERWFAVLEGDGVVLAGGLGTHRLTGDSDPFRFDGGVPVECTLAHGPTRDFNLMALPGRGRMQRVRGAAGVRAPAGALLALYTHAAGAHLRTDDDALVLPPYHLAWTLAAEPALVQVTAHDALWMEAFP
jgi:environmental stress-induced protein Ves